MGQATQSADERFVREGSVEADDELFNDRAELWEKGEVPDEAAGLVGDPGESRA